MTIRVVGIQLAKATRLPMTAVDNAEVETQAGLIGDRYHGSRHRQLSVQSLEELAEAEAAFGMTIDPLLTRRNITISRGRLPRTPGHRWSVGPGAARSGARRGALQDARHGDR